MLRATDLLTKGKSWLSLRCPALSLSVYSPPSSPSLSAFVERLLDIFVTLRAGMLRATDLSTEMFQATDLSTKGKSWLSLRSHSVCIHLGAPLTRPPNPNPFDKSVAPAGRWDSRWASSRRAESPPGSVGREAGLGLAACARPMGQVWEEWARFAPFKRPHPARPGRASRSCHTSSRVEVDLDSVAGTPPPHGSTGFGIWQCPQLLPAARHSAGPRAIGVLLQCLACTARAGRSRVLLAKLLGGK